jgi:hypothetical protein
VVGFRWLQVASGVQREGESGRGKERAVLGSCSNAILEQCPILARLAGYRRWASFKSPLDSGDLVMDNSSPFGGGDNEARKASRGALSLFEPLTPSLVT